MLTPRIILLHQKLSATGTARLFPRKPWIFLGRDYAVRAAWEKALGRTFEIDYKPLLTRLSYELRDEYIEWAAELGRDHWHNWQWWTTVLATRSNITSPLYLYVCYLEVLEELLKGMREPLIVVAESWELFDMVEASFKERIGVEKPGILSRTGGRVLYNAKMACMYALAGGKFFGKSILQWAAARSTRLRAAGPRREVFDPKHIVIHTCLDDACFGDDGKFHDRYYPGLADYLRDRGYPVSTLVWWLNVEQKKVFSAFKWLRSRKESFLIPQDYFGLIDCFRSFMAVFKSAGYRFPEEKQFFRKKSLFHIVESERKRQYRSHGTMYFMNMLPMFRKWKRLGYKLDTFIDFWELRNCEVPTLVAIKENFPECRTVGYQHAALLPKLLFAGYKTTPAEFAASVHPDMGFVNSAVTLSFLATQGFPETFMKLAPALRYRYLEGSHKVPCSNGSEKGILICLPMSTGSAREMLEVCHRAFTSNQIRLPVWIKRHPMAKAGAIERRVELEWPENVSMVDGSMADWLPRAIVVVSGESATMVESVYRGIPTIVLRKRTDIDIIPLDVLDSNGAYALACDHGELFQQLSAALRDATSQMHSNRDALFSFDMHLLDDLFPGTAFEKRN